MAQIGISARNRGVNSVTVNADRRCMDLSAIALQGLEQSQAQLENAATRLAGAGAGSPDGAGVDIVDLSAEIVALMSAKTQFSANLSTLKTANQIQKSALDVMA
jgi:flagellar hook protein FlgE